MPKSIKAKTIYSKEYKGLASKLKQARLSLGMTQTQVAKILGRPQSYMSKIESAQYYLDVFELKKLATVYRKSIAYFMGNS